MRAVDAVKRQLASSDRWLLVLDNADEIEKVRPFIPERNGHVLLTTRAYALGTLAKRIEVKQMNAEEATQLLLLRAKIENAQFDAAAARTIATTLLDGLPLALDQAGAYIEETGCGLTDYVCIYEKHAQELLKRRGMAPADHPEPVATTWALSFERIEQANPAAANLLRFCAFLAPDGIPEEILASLIPEKLALNDAIATILRFSLLTRDTNGKTVDMHRLVQQVLKHGMSKEDERSWAELTVRTVDRAFPNPQKRFEWPRCERLLPHAFACAELITDHDLESKTAARLLINCGGYLNERARYAEAEPLFRRSLAILENLLGPENANVATSMNDLAVLYGNLGHYAKAEPLFQRSLAIRERALGPEDPKVAQSLTNLGLFYYDRGRYTEAEPLLQRSLTILENALGPEHPKVAQSLNNLGAFYHSCGRHAEAELFFQRSLGILEKCSAEGTLATTLNNLAELYLNCGDFNKAEALQQRARAILEKRSVPNTGVQ